MLLLSVPSSEASRNSLAQSYHNVRRLDSALLTVDAGTPGYATIYSDTSYSVTEDKNGGNSPLQASFLSQVKEFIFLIQLLGSARLQSIPLVQLLLLA